MGPEEREDGRERDEGGWGGGIYQCTLTLFGYLTCSKEVGGAGRNHGAQWSLDAKTPPPVCKDNTKVRKFDGNNAELTRGLFSRGRGGLAKGLGIRLFAFDGRGGAAPVARRSRGAHRTRKGTPGSGELGTSKISNSEIWCGESLAPILTGEGGGRILHQVKFAVVDFAVGAPWVEWIPPPAESQCVPLVCEKFAENPEFRVGNFAVNLKREISHAKLKCHETPAPPM